MGWIERYIDLVFSRVPQAPRRFAEIGGIHAINTAVGRNVFMPLAGGMVYPNFSHVLVGQSSVTFKTTVQDVEEAALRSVAPELQIAEEWSPEGLGGLLSERSSKGDGTGLCHVWCRLDEFGRLLSGFRKEWKADLEETIILCLDGKPLNKVLVKTTQTQDPICWSMFGATTPSRLVSLVKPEDVEMGFPPRVIFCMCSPNGFAPQPDNTAQMDHDEAQLTAELASLRKKYMASTTEVRWSADARGFWESWCHDLYDRAVAGDMHEVVFGRMQNHFIRFAIASELSETMAYLGPKFELTYDRATATEKLIAPYIDDMATLFKMLGPQRHFARVRNVIEQAGGQITYRNLNDRACMETRTLREVLDYMEKGGEIVLETVRTGSRGPMGTIIRTVNLGGGRTVNCGVTGPGPAARTQAAPPLKGGEPLKKQRGPKGCEEE